jgi:hypothetical protein
MKVEIGSKYWSIAITTIINIDSICYIHRVLIRDSNNNQNL